MMSIVEYKYNPIYKEKLIQQKTMVQHFLICLTKCIKNNLSMI